MTSTYKVKDHRVFEPVFLATSRNQVKVNVGLFDGIFVVFALCLTWLF